MKTKVIALICLAMLLSLGAQAQITIESLQRQTSILIEPLDGPPQGQSSDVLTLDPDYSQDMDRTVGDMYARSRHISAVVLDGSTLEVSGSFMGYGAETEEPRDGTVSARAALILQFTVDTVSYVDLEVDLDAGGVVYFYDLTANDYSFDHQGPGNFPLARALVPGNLYLLQVYSMVGIAEGTGMNALESSDFLMSVSTEPVAADPVALDAVKALYR